GEDDDLRARIARWMTEPARVEERVGALGRRLAGVVDVLAGAPAYQQSWDELALAPTLAGPPPPHLQAPPAALARRGFVVEGGDRRFESFGARLIGLPLELGDGLARRRRESVGGLFAVLSLHGHLDHAYVTAERGASMPPRRLRELYKMYAQ